MRSRSASQGFLAIEIILAITTLGIIALAIGGLFSQGQTATVSAGKRTTAILLAKEGLEAVRSIRDDVGLVALEAGTDPEDIRTYELDRRGSQWMLVPDTDELINDIYTRTIYIDPIDPADPEVRIVYSVVGWDENTSRPGVAGLVTILSNWQVEAIPEDIIP